MYNTFQAMRFLPRPCHMHSKQRIKTLTSKVTLPKENRHHNIQQIPQARPFQKFVPKTYTKSTKETTPKSNHNHSIHRAKSVETTKVCKEFLPNSKDTERTMSHKDHLPNSPPNRQQAQRNNSSPRVKTNNKYYTKNNRKKQLQKYTNVCTKHMQSARGNKITNEGTISRQPKHFSPLQISNTKTTRLHHKTKKCPPYRYFRWYNKGFPSSQKDTCNNQFQTNPPIQVKSMPKSKCTTSNRSFRNIHHSTHKPYQTHNSKTLFPTIRQNKANPRKKFQPTQVFPNKSNQDHFRFNYLKHRHAKGFPLTKYSYPPNSTTNHRFINYPKYSKEK